MKETYEKDPVWVVKLKYWTKKFGIGSASVWICLKVPFIRENFSDITVAWINNAMAWMFLFCVFWSYNEIKEWADVQINEYRRYKEYVETKKNQKS